MKIGIALEGGGMRGMYTAGVLDVLLDKGLQPAMMSGTSAGAIFGINFASKQRGRTIRYNKRYMRDRRYISLESFIKTGNLINQDFGCRELPLKLDPFDEVAFEQSGIRFFATITNMRTGKAEYIEIKNCLEQVDVLWASSALPIITRPVEWHGEHYLDGGLADNIPMQKCVDEGCDKIIVVLTHPYGYVKREPLKHICKLVYQDYPNLLETIDHRNKTYNRYLAHINQLEAEEKIFVLRPSEKMTIKRLERNADKLQGLYDLGVKDGKKQWKALDAYLSQTGR